MGSWQTHKEHKVWGFMWLCLFYTKGQYWQTRRVWKSTSAPGFAQRKGECQQPKVMDAGDRKSVLDVQMNGGGFCWDILQMETNTFFKWVINIKENCKCKLCHHHMYFEGHITACFLTRRKNAQNRTDNFCKQILILGHSGYSNLAFLWRFLPVFAWAVAEILPMLFHCYQNMHVAVGLQHEKSCSFNFECRERNFHIVINNGKLNLELFNFRSEILKWMLYRK